MKTKSTWSTAALVASGVAAASWALTGGDLGQSCPAEAAACAGCPSGLTTSVEAACPVDLTAKPATTSYQVSGLSCEACETKLTQALGKVAGVGESTACAKTGLTKVSYDPAKVKQNQLLAAIADAGFKVEGEVVELKVTGLDCSGCAGKVSEALTAVEGVKNQEVCTESKVAKVTFDPTKTCRETIVAAIDKTGFTVTP